VDFYVDGDDNIYDYYYYEYWIWLNDLLPALQEGKDVFDQIVAIDEMDLEAMDDATIEAISDMYNDYLNLSEEAKSLLDPEYVETLRDLAIQAVESYVDELPLTVEAFDDLFNDEETKDAAVTSLLNAWNAYQAMSDELKDGMDELQRAHLEAVYNRYLELSATQMDLSILALIIVHLSVGAYFAFKKRDVLIKIND